MSPSRNWQQGGRHGGGGATCPMCGASVSNLAAHVRDKHDDAVSHPRD